MEIEPKFMYSLFLWIAMAGIVVSLMNIRKALFTGMSVAWMIMVFLFIMSFSTLKSETTSLFMFVVHILTKSGIIFMPMLIVGFYLFQCVARNKTYIEENSMPDAWYLFSYFVAIFTGLNIGMITWYLKTFEINSEEQVVAHSLSMLCTTLLFTFVSIETVICSYFRTDGFTL
jgi:hypothetical protein